MTINSLISFFKPEGEISIEENFDTLSIKFKPGNFVITQSIPDFLECINSRDKLQIDTIIGDDEPIRYSTVTNDFSSYLNKYQQRISIIESEEVVETNIYVYKSINKKIVSIYSVDAFTNYIEKLSITNVIASLKKLDFDISEITFESQNEEILLITQSIQFTKINASQNDIVSLDREPMITKQKSAGSFSLLEDYPFIPDDFSVLRIDENNENSKKLKVVFDRLCTLYSVGFVYDLVSVNQEVVSYKLNGYKVFKNQIKCSDIPLASKGEYFSIYSWCYNSGNFNDKIGLSRNIVSLHLESNNEILLKGSPFQAIQSSYKVYEKQNIKQYIEIRNKMSDQILAFSEKANKIVETFASGFQKTALAFVSLFATIVISRVLAAHNFNNVFTGDGTIIALAFLSISLLYFFVCKWEIDEQQKRFKASYDNMKDRNTDLLTKDDIERILNSDKEFNSDYSFIGKKKKYYSVIWISFITIFVILVSVSYLLGTKNNNTSQTKADKSSNQVESNSLNHRKDTAKQNASKFIAKPDSLGKRK